MLGEPEQKKTENRHRLRRWLIWGPWAPLVAARERRAAGRPRAEKGKGRIGPAILGALATNQFGKIYPNVECPHCHTTGRVRMKSARVKAGVSGAKATGAILTGGASVLATGLSRKKGVLQAFCSHCHISWTVE
jgi:hypothetical protein